MKKEFSNQPTVTVINVYRKNVNNIKYGANYYSHYSQTILSTDHTIRYKSKIAKLYSITLTREHANTMKHLNEQ